MYNQMAQVLVGHDKTGSILQFDRAGDTTDVGTKMKEVIFLNFSRLLTKDEIKKEAFTLTFLTGGTVQNRNPGAGDYVVSDYGASTTYKTNSPAGEYAILYSGSDGATNSGVGLLYYQAGIAVLTASIFSQAPASEGHLGGGTPDIQFGPNASNTVDTASIDRVLTGSNITASCDGVRNAWKNVSFNNSTELNSTIYFCRVNHNEFNYSSNPTYLSSSQIRVKSKRTDAPVSYITTVGLYSADNVLMAVAKLSEPLKKTPSNEFTLRVRLDY
jgi:hypothetical protein